MNDRRVILFVMGTAAAITLTASRPVFAQTTFTAWSIAGAAQGNFRMLRDYGVCQDFEVLRPITVSELGMFDDGEDGIQGSAVARIQLYEAGSKEARLLETMTFDAVNSGELRGGFRFKPLARPVTLWPGKYTLTANGFDETNKAYNVEKAEWGAVRVRLNDGGGRILFVRSNRYFERGDRLARSKLERMIGPADRFGAATFVFSPAPVAPVPYAADYAALTAGVDSFPVVTNRTVMPGYNFRYGSIALLTEAAFPVLVEHGGNWLVLEAAGTWQGDPNGGRCVVFSHEQFGHAFGDGRATLFENAIKWASRKSNPSEITIGISQNMDATYFQSRGYQVQLLDPATDQSDCECGVLGINFRDQYSEQFMAGVAAHLSRGGGLVATFLPYRVLHEENRRSSFDRVNQLLEPLGLAYRSSFTQPADFGFTNIVAGAYPPYFNAFPAAQLLYENREGQVELDSLAKAIALHTVAYAADGQPDRLAILTALSTTGRTNTTQAAEPPTVEMGPIADVASMSGAQAKTNSLGAWSVDGNAVVGRGGRGAVQYLFQVPAPSVYRLQIQGTSALQNAASNDFDLVLAVDGVELGRRVLSARMGRPGTVECWTPFLLAGEHTLRVFWDDASAYRVLRVGALRVQTGTGADSDGDGIQDWVAAWVHAQSGLDQTNEDLVSLTSPMCLEGTDPYPSLMKITVAGAGANAPQAKARTAAAGRWYADVPLAKNGDTVVQVSYQNGAKTETRQVHWQAVNVLQGGSFTIRQDDSLALVARPEPGWSSEGQMQFMVDTNAVVSREAAGQMTYRFTETGVFAVKGAYVSPKGLSQSGSITVTVVGHSFTNQPVCWVGQQRSWDVPSVVTQVVLEADNRLLIEQTAALPDQGRRFSLLIDQVAPRVILSRLGEKGPILDSTRANGFRAFGARDTYNRVIETYADGSRLVEMMVVLSPLLPELKVQLRISVGGVTFDDGTRFRELSATDFDALGRCKVRFIVAASAQTANCYNLKVFQGENLVGSY